MQREKRGTTESENTLKQNTSLYGDSENAQSSSDEGNIPDDSDETGNGDEAAETDETDRIDEVREFKSELKLFLLKIAVILVSVWLVFTFLFGIAVVSGEKMYPRMRDGDLAVYYRLDKNYAAGDIVTWHADGARYFGRVVAVGGDTVDMTEQGQLLINGSIQNEEIFYETFLPKDATGYPMTVPDGSVYVLGDFRIGSAETDSRTFGPLDCKKDTDGTLISLLRRRGL